MKNTTTQRKESGKVQIGLLIAVALAAGGAGVGSKLHAAVERLDFSGSGTHATFQTAENGVLTTTELFVSVAEDSAGEAFLGVEVKQIVEATGEVLYVGQGETSSIDFAIGPDFENAHLNADLQVGADNGEVLDVHLVVNWVGGGATETLSTDLQRIVDADGTLTQRHQGYVRKMETAGSVKISIPGTNGPTLTLPPAASPAVAWSSSSSGKLVTKSQQTSQSSHQDAAVLLTVTITSTGYWTGFWTWNSSTSTWFWTWVWNSSGQGWTAS